ncbi:hypothetical protein N7474_000670 [Penicillium riverlandense]|uniref:uncharacterized protein n=1 Tax=Penicillium riverlandense TaxID=1903569 RepID=UPI002547A3D3|nr:uncharacterized protein N7474_000670 [Penicillium riverlandense]KAJ5832359.1 hypothetical protein N7474_000670 [Penicillium riverlandense]
MPWIYTPSDGIYGHPQIPPNDYLREITDVASLECLRLDNVHREYPGYGPVVPYRHILPSMFTGARSLRSLTVERFGPDIARLIQLVREEQASIPTSPAPKLDTLQVLEYGRTLRFEEEEDSIMWQEDEEGPVHPIYSVPLHEVGHHWRRLCYSGFSKPRQNPERVVKAAELLRFASQCSELEELAVPIHGRDELEMLKEEVLPKLPHLRVLHLPWGDLADFLEGLDRPQPLSPSGHINDMTEQQQEEFEQPNEKLDQDRERRRFAIVREIFLCHHQLRVEQPGMSPLKYVAINEEAYTREFLPVVPETTRHDTPEVDDSYTLPDRSTVIPGDGGGEESRDS